MGSPIKDEKERAEAKAAHQLRGIPDEEALFEQAIKWDRNVDPDFEKKWFRDCTASPIEEGAWLVSQFASFASA